MPSYSPFWGPNVNDYKLLVNRNPRRNAVRRAANRDSFRAFTKLFGALVGAAPGSGVTASYARVKHMYRSGDAQQGKFVETVSVLNRNTNSADVTALKEMTVNVRTAPNYAADRSGNGGKAFNP